MPHWKLTLAYDGTSYAGWQVQPGRPTVQGTLAEALRNLLHETILPQGSGRTDAGVHALGQVASFSTAADIPPDSLLRALNRTLPAAIRVTHAIAVPPGFHARHSATGKLYQYRVFPLRTPRSSQETFCSPFLAPYVWPCRWPLDCDAMNRAACHLLGEQDFTSFAASDPDRSARIAAAQANGTEPAADTPPTNIRQVHSVVWTTEGDLLVFHIAGSGFLHHMVRNIVGTLVDVGRGRRLPEDLPGMLTARDRAATGPTAPARGLFLKSVEYPDIQGQGAGGA